MKHLLGLIVLAFALASPSSAGGFYVGAYGGLNYADVIDAPFVEDNTGVVLGGVVGTSISAVPGLRVEADLSYRNNEVNVFKFITADHETTALMGNVVYDLPLNLGRFHPYALAGVGVSQSDVTFENVALLRLESTGVAYQLGAGVSVDVAPGVSVGLGYRYFKAPEIEILGTELSDGSNHSAVASVNFSFN